MSLKNRVRKLETARGFRKREEDRQGAQRFAVQERLFSLFHNCPKKLDGWEKFKALYLRPGISKLGDLSMEGIQTLKQVFID